MLSSHPQTVLVTGGAGYIGSHTCKLLAESGFVPVTYDCLSTGHRWAVQWGPFEQGDVSDSNRLREVFRKYDFKGVFHFAASSYVGESVQNPAKYYQNNVGGALSLLQVMGEFGVRSLVFSSTCAVIGLPKKVPISEEESTAPVNPYGSSKLMIERILKDYDAAYGLKSVSLRYFNAAGADLEGKIGEKHEPETHLIPLALEAALDSKRTLVIHGDDYDTADGTCIRDYIHVSDLASAHLLAMQWMNETKSSGTFHLGSSRGFSVKEIVSAVETVTQSKLFVRIGPRRPGDPPILVADSSRAYENLRWKPQFSELSQIIDSAWRWRKKSE